MPNEMGMDALTQRAVKGRIESLKKEFNEHVEAEIPAFINSPVFKERLFAAGLDETPEVIDFCQWLMLQRAGESVAFLEKKAYGK